MSSPAVMAGGGQLVVFSIGAGEYAFPIEAVHEIVRFEPPRPVSSDRPWHLGVMSLRGQLLPVVDLAARLGVPVADAAERCTVIVEAGDTRAGVVVDAVEEVLSVDAGQVEPLPGSSDPALEGIAQVGERLVAVVDPAAVVS